MKRVLMFLASMGLCIYLTVPSLALSFGGIYNGVNSAPKFNGIPVDTTQKTEKTEQLPSYTAIDFNTQSAEVYIKPGDAFSIRYCFYTDLYELSCQVSKGKLTVQTTYAEKYLKNGRKNQSMSGNWNFPPNTITITYPAQTVFTDINGQNNYGDVELDGMQAENIRLHLMSGDLQLNNVTPQTIAIENAYGKVDILSDKKVSCKNLHLDLSSGDVRVKNLSADTASIEDDYGSVTIDDMTADTLKLDVSSGDIKVSNTTAKEIEIDDSYGQITMKNIASSQLKVEGSSGDIDIEGRLSGKTEIQSSYGDVSVTVRGKNEGYAYSLETDYGTIAVDGKTVESKWTKQNSSAANQIEVSADSGDIRLNFRDHA